MSLMPKVNPEKLEKDRMKKLVGAHFLFIVLLFALITPAYASVKIQAVIDQNVHVAFDFENINSTLYNEVVQQGIFNVSTIPRTIVKNLEQRNLTDVTWGYDPELEMFNDATKSIHVEFYLAGSDIVSLTINKTTMNRMYNVRTDWRKFHVNLTNEFLLDFTEHFATPISQSPPWQRINNYTLNAKKHPAYYIFTDSDTFDLLCYFILPATAINVHAVEDMMIFELPPSFEDSMLNSPFLILGAIIFVIIASSLYRKVRK